MPSNIVVIEPDKTEEDWEILRGILAVTEVIIDRFHTLEEGLHV
jgi:hypothetical protein